MKSRYLFKGFLGVFLAALLLLSSCGAEKVCAGLNHNTGSANSPKGARKGNRGGYKSARELEARDRQKKRVRKSKKRASGRTSGKKNTTGKKGFHLRISFKGRYGSGSAHASGGVKY